MSQSEYYPFPQKCVRFPHQAEHKEIAHEFSRSNTKQLEGTHRYHMAGPDIVHLFLRAQGNICLSQGQLDRTSRRKAPMTL